MKVLLAPICFAVGIAGTTSAAAYGTRHYLYAACNHEIHGVLGYSGPRHRDAADAQKDCQEHLKIYPRHPCVLRPINY